jgi:PPOX class probable F420-dependent enzyme
VRATRAERACRGTYAVVMDEPYAGDAPVRAADHPLASAKYVALTTFRRTGAPVTTPVWFAPSLDEPGMFAVITVDDTGKTKRLAHTDSVDLQACDIRGRVAPGAPTFHGTARVVRDAEAVASVRRAIVARYGLPARFSDLSDRLGSMVGLKRAPRAGILVSPEPTPGERRAGPAPQA